jgi:hypothetical protein
MFSLVFPKCLPEISKFSEALHWQGKEENKIKEGKTNFNFIILLLGINRNNCKGQNNLNMIQTYSRVCVKENIL